MNYLTVMRLFMPDFLPVGWQKKPSDGRLSPSDGSFRRRTDKKHNEKPC
jgi:hypothetical protein